MAFPHGEAVQDWVSFMEQGHCAICCDWTVLADSRMIWCSNAHRGHAGPRNISAFLPNADARSGLATKERGRSAPQLDDMR